MNLLINKFIERLPCHVLSKSRADNIRTNLKPFHTIVFGFDGLEQE